MWPLGCCYTSVTANKRGNCTVMLEGYHNSSFTNNINCDVQTCECYESAVFRLIARMVAWEIPR